MSGYIERWTIHETSGAGIIRPGKLNAVVSGRVLDEGEKVTVIRADDYEGVVARLEAAEQALVLQLGSHKLAEIAIRRRLEAKCAAAEPEEC